jgi:Protein of unknown function (DUF2793)
MDTPNLNLPYIAAGQAQKHVTHNEAIRALDAVVQLSVLDRGLTSPPGSPVEGDRHIVAAGATGAWSTHDLEIAAWQDGAWAFYARLRDGSHGSRTKRRCWPSMAPIGSVQRHLQPCRTSP